MLSYFSLKVNDKYLLNEMGDLRCEAIHHDGTNATACADMHFWNEKMGRWVNRGAEGIALFDENNRKRLRYVFDVSDTNSFYGNEVKLWKVKEQYKDDIVRTLINSFGECADFEFESVIDDTARNLVEDNSLDYIDAIFDCKEDSFMEELDELTVGVETKNLLSSSIGFVIMERCGLNPRDFYDASDFSDLFKATPHN